MRKRLIIFSVLALFGQVIQGLLLHPYQTMQNLVREKIFAWLSFVPIVLLIFSWGLHYFYQVVFMGCEVFISFLPVAQFIFEWWLSFLVYWQLLLFYLLLRFAWAFWTD